MPATSYTRIANNLVSSTLEHYSPEMADQIHRSIPMVWFYMEKAPEAVRIQRGGREFRTNILYQKNTNAKSFRGYDRINVNPTEEFTQISEFWSGIVTAVAMSFDDTLENMGEEALFDLTQDKMQVAQMGLRQLLAQQLVQGKPGGSADDPFLVANGNRACVPGNFGKDFLPLGFLLQKDFTVGYTVHGVTQSTAGNEWWQNQVKRSTFAASGAIALKMEMDNLYNNCSKGSSIDFPNFGIFDQALYEYYCNSMLSLQRFPVYEDNDAVSAGFAAVKYKRMLLFMDDFVPNFGDLSTDAVSLTQDPTKAVGFFLNSNWMRFFIHPLANFTPTEFVEPEDQLAAYAKIVFKGQQTITQRRKLGLYYSVDTTVAF